MYTSQRNILSIVALFFYLLTGALLEVTHHEALSVPTRSHHTFLQHDCGQHERHVAPEAFHCLACTLTNHRVAVETTACLPPYFVSVTLGCFGTSVTISSDADLHHSGKRGPPPTLA